MSPLASIGDAVITADVNGRITFLNPVAESVTGWTLAEATGVPLEGVFRIINEEGRQPVESPTVRALRDGVVVGLANHTLLISKDGTERPIDDSAAPIRNDKGEVAGVVLVFRDVTERRRQEEQVRDALAYAENIIATVRESLIVLDKDLRVQTANRTFYQSFHVSKEDTENRLLFDLGNRQWDVPELRTLLKEILPRNHSFHDFEVEHDFPMLGKRIMLLNARRFVPMNSMPELILLAIEDVTERRRAEAQVKENELRYRRLFETAKDGILILDAGTGKITDANPFLTELLGYSHAELRGKELWQIGLFQDAEANRAVYRLCTTGATSATTICRSKTEAGNRWRSSSSATSTRWITGRSSSATFGTSPHAASWSGRRRRRKRRRTSTAAKTSSWRCCLTNSATRSLPS